MSAVPSKILLIGWDAADWKVSTPLLDAGRMPNLEKIVNNGVMGNLATQYPDLSPMLWTSIATGKRPFKHGIYGFTEPDPHGGGIRPITNISRRTKAIWNILSQLGHKCAVVGWWPSHPVEPINGVMVSNHYQQAVGPKDKPWPLRPGTVHPPRIGRNLAELRVHPQDLAEGHILPFVPNAAQIDQEKDKRLSSLAKIIAENLSIERAALAILHHEPWEFAAVYFDGIDHFCHAFMRYHPPRLDWVDEADFEMYKDVVAGGYILHDIILGRLLQAAGEDAHVMLVSDHGFQPDHLRPRHIPREPAGPAVQHRHYGIFVMKGPGILEDERIYGASQLDVTPTLLAIMGLPVGRDMDGKPLLTAFETPPEVMTIPSWDQEPGNAGMHPKGKRIDPLEAREAIAQLVALGYIDKPHEDQEMAVAQTVRELDYNLSRAYMDAGLHVEAVPILEKLIEKWPDEHRFGTHLVACLQALGRIKEARTLLEAVFVRKEEAALKAREELKAISEKHKDKKPEDFSEKEQFQFRDLRARASFNPYAMAYLMGSLLFAEGDEAQALAHLKRAEQADPSRPDLHLKLGAVYLKMKRWDDAETCFNKALDLDPDSAEGYRGLAQACLPQRRNQDAAEAALTSVGLLFHNPLGHFLLGVALHRLRELPRALEALKVAVAQNPNFPEAHRRLAYIYRKRLLMPQKADKHLQLALEAAVRIRGLRRGNLAGQTVETRSPDPAAPSAKETSSPPFPKAPSSPPFPKGGPGGIFPEGTPLEPQPLDLSQTIVIVSGLPRSGTSMMMQMLQAGGLPLLVDDHRPLDPDNPRGYFEYEPVKRLARDASWLPGVKGRAVKIIAPLLGHLPPSLPCRVIFMARDMDEVMRSQAAMLARQGEEGGADLSPDRLAGVFAAQARQALNVLKRRGISCMVTDYVKAVNDPARAAEGIRRFLGGTLDEKAMAEAVDAGLRRQGPTP